MAHFAVIAPPLRGHFDPLSVLASELMTRGHTVTFLHQEDARELISAPGAGFEAIGSEAPEVATWTRPMSRIHGLLGLSPVMQRMRYFTDMFCSEGPAALRRIGVDVVIADQLEPGGALVAEHLGLPWISAAAALPMNRDMNIPPPFVGWAYGEGKKAVDRNRGGWRVSDFLMRGLNAGIVRNAAVLGLPRKRCIQDCFSPLLQISQLVPGLDFPRTGLPATFHYTGPWRHPNIGEFPLPADSRTTVYATLGTLQGTRCYLFRKIARACDRAGARLVIATGYAALSADALAGDPLVFDWVPQRALLQDVDLVVAHAGLNTVLDSLAAGRPLILLPLAFEQPAIAARVEYAGAGIKLSRRASVRRIADAVLRATYCAMNAKRIQQQIAESGGVALAADLIERAIGTAPARTASATRERAARDDARDDSRSGSK